MKIKIYADNTYRKLDSNSLVLLSDLPAFTDSGWKSYEILGLEPSIIGLDEPTETSSGGIIESKRNFWGFNCVFMPKWGLDNYPKYFELVQQLLKPHKYFVVEDYNATVESWFTATDKAVCFKYIGKIEAPESDYERAKKSLTVKMRKVNINA